VIAVLGDKFTVPRLKRQTAQRRAACGYKL
jgi:hypothetical protein